jgi:hypothetical protein
MEITRRETLLQIASLAIEGAARLFRVGCCALRPLGLALNGYCRRFSAADAESRDAPMQFVAL